MTLFDLAVQKGVVDRSRSLLAHRREKHLLVGRVVVRTTERQDEDSTDAAVPPERQRSQRAYTAAEYRRVVGRIGDHERLAALEDTHHRALWRLEGLDSAGRKAYRV